MKTIAVIIKSIKEQLRSYWVLLLTLSMGPFFIFVYFLITETSKTSYDLSIVNNDKGVIINGEYKNFGNELIAQFEETTTSFTTAPFVILKEISEENGIAAIKNKKTDALIVIDSEFSKAMLRRNASDDESLPTLTFIGDLTSTEYLISAVWANEVINSFVLDKTQSHKLFEIKETALGQTATISEFNLLVPGILIVSLIMLMFTASIAFVSEVENKTIMRLRLSKINSESFLGGIAVVQLIIGLSSMALTLITAILLGFEYSGSLTALVLVGALTSLSIIAFSLIIAAITKTAGEVLVVGNFPMFLFMFFSGAAFPLKSSTLLTIAGYPINTQGLMTPTHAISALNKTLVMNMNLSSILPEIIAILVLTIIYFLIGGILFQRKHLKLNH